MTLHATYRPVRPQRPHHARKRATTRPRAGEKSCNQRLSFAAKKPQPRLHCSQQFSVVALTTSSATIAERYAYSAYGAPTVCNASGTDIGASTKDNRITYTGREWDDELLLYHFRARLYDARVGRFLGRDPIGLSVAFSNYLFVGDNPGGYLDPLGLFEVRTRYWIERHHWFPLAQRAQIEGLCAGFNVDAFATPLLAARDYPSSGIWERLTGEELPPATDSYSYHDHRWLENWRNPKWKDVVNQHLALGNCCKFLSAMIPEIIGAYRELRQRSIARGDNDGNGIYPPELVIMPYIGPFSQTFPARETIFDELIIEYDYSGINTLNLLLAARAAACSKGKRNPVDCKEWVNDRRIERPVSGGSIRQDPSLEIMIFAPIIKIPSFPIIRRSPASTPHIFPYPRPIDVPLEPIRRAG
jgi:RHS repeat-associated protein